MNNPMDNIYAETYRNTRMGVQRVWVKSPKFQKPLQPNSGSGFVARVSDGSWVTSWLGVYTKSVQDKCSHGFLNNGGLYPKIAGTIFLCWHILIFIVRLWDYSSGSPWLSSKINVLVRYISKAPNGYHARKHAWSTCISVCVLRP